jgi:hypothetical protein
MGWGGVEIKKRVYIVLKKTGAWLWVGALWRAHNRLWQAATTLWSGQGGRAPTA